MICQSGDMVVVYKILEGASPEEKEIAKAFLGAFCRVTYIVRSHNQFGPIWAIEEPTEREVAGQIYQALGFAEDMLMPLKGLPNYCEDEDARFFDAGRAVSTL